MKTVKRDESVARSRFVDCPVCNNHTLKLKRSVQVGRCKNCHETYKIIVVYVKTGRKTKAQTPGGENKPEVKSENKHETHPESSLPSWQLPSDSSLFGPTSDNYSGLSDAIFGKQPPDQGSGSGSSSGQ